MRSYNNLNIFFKIIIFGSTALYVEISHIHDITKKDEIFSIEETIPNCKYILKLKLKGMVITKISSNGIWLSIFIAHLRILFLPRIVGCFEFGLIIDETLKNIWYEFSSALLDILRSFIRTFIAIFYANSGCKDKLTLWYVREDFELKQNHH